MNDPEPNNRESDIDLLVLVDTEGDEFRSELWRIASAVSLDYNVVISPRVFGKASWAETRRIRMPLYRVVAADGIPLTPESDGRDAGASASCVEQVQRLVRQVTVK